MHSIEYLSSGEKRRRKTSANILVKLLMSWITAVLIRWDLLRTDAIQDVQLPQHSKQARKHDDLDQTNLLSFHLMNV